MPEGVYRIVALNPNSSYHLSMKLDYPTEFDLSKARAEGRTRPGSDIFIHGKAVSIGCVAVGDDAIEEIFVLVREDAEHFGCVAEVEHARSILQRGTSAHRQLRTYEEALVAGANEREALAAVVDMLVRETVGGAQRA